MKIKVLLLAFLCYLPSLAGITTTITDGYIGGVPTLKKDIGKDVFVGTENKFNITKATSVIAPTAIISIYTSYVNNIGANKTQLGDLFLSTDGWRPSGTSGYASDTGTFGETWEYGLVLNNRTATMGSLSLYKINNQDADILFSDEVYSGQRRTGQEVLVNTATAQSLGTIGTWSTDKSLGFISFSFDYESTIKNMVVGRDIGMHWTTTNANDVIEGSMMSVPAPETYLIFLTGAIALASFGLTRKVA